MARQQTVRKLGYKDPRGYEYALIDIGELVPDFNNPRIPSQDSALESILRLLTEDADGMFNLAADIIEHGGTNPAELTNVTPVGDGHFVVREGNRRLAVRKLLRNPEQLKGHLSDSELKRWRTLAQDARSKALPSALVCVIGDDHEAWVDRRHLGPQGGRGLIQWDTEAKRRRDQRRSGERDLAVHVLDAIKAHDPGRFGDLDPPKRTFTTFARVVESTDGRAALGLDVDEHGHILLKRGEQSIRLLEEILRDLRKQGSAKLTSRKIHSSEQIVDYLEKAKKRIPAGLKSALLTLGSGAAATNGGKTVAAGRGKGAGPVKDVMRGMHLPKDRRLRAIFEELRKARRQELPNAAIVLTRVLLELSIDAYATLHNLPFAGDIDPTLEHALPVFYEELNRANISIPKDIREALKWAKRQPMSLADKLEAVLNHLASRNVIKAKEASALSRQLRAADVLPMLNDAVHRLKISPTVPRVNHILEAVEPVFNGIHQAE